MATPTRTLTVIKPNRLDKAVASLLPELSRSAAQKLIDQGRILVNGSARDASFRVQVKDVIVVQMPEPEQALPQAEPAALDVIYQDDDVIAVNKPAGMVVHPAAGNASGTLVNALLAYAPNVSTVGDERRPGIVHRLDKETSGLLLIARTPSAHAALQAQFKSRAIKKTYLALCVGRVQPERGLINKPIARDPGNRKRMAIVQGGRDAVTKYAVAEVFIRSDGNIARAYSLVRAHPLTGRTHQLRVHFASIGFPIIGDALYGARKDPLTHALAPRQMLHSSELVFALPSTGLEKKLHAPMPEDMRRVIDDLTP
jgi:23S rRNA pseudouridine1911/1915/1917 synthase